MFYSKKIVIKVVFGDDVPVLNGVWSFNKILAQFTPSNLFHLVQSMS